MKTNDEKMPNCFRWLRAVRAQISRETKGMTDEEYCAYIRSSVEEYRRDSSVSAPRKSKAVAKAPARRRKAEKRLAHA